MMMNKIIYILVITFIFLSTAQFCRAQYLNPESHQSPYYLSYKYLNYEYLFTNPTGTKIDKYKNKPILEKEVKVVSDTSGTRNKITVLRPFQDYHILKIELVEYGKSIKINVYNLLGKKVLDVFEGVPSENKDYPYRIDSYKLPNGVYICAVYGDGFKVTEKFIVAR